MERRGEARIIIMSGTRIITCACASEFQDTRYGQGRRVANVNEGGVAHCAVCGKEHGKKANTAEAAKKADK